MNTRKRTVAEDRLARLASYDARTGYGRGTRRAVLGTVDQPLPMIDPHDEINAEARHNREQITDAIAGRRVAGPRGLAK